MTDLIWQQKNKVYWQVFVNTSERKRHGGHISSWSYQMNNGITVKWCVWAMRSVWAQRWHCTGFLWIIHDSAFITISSFLLSTISSRKALSPPMTEEDPSCFIQSCVSGSCILSWIAFTPSSDVLQHHTCTLIKCEPLFLVSTDCCKVSVCYRKWKLCRLT